MKPDFTSAVWRKSTHSGQGGECVEIAVDGGHVGVRDSKNPDAGTLVFSRGEFAGFIEGIKRDEFTA